VATDVGSYPNLIGGEWKVSTGSTLENHNPAELQGDRWLFPLATLEDTKDAIESARAAFPVWAKTPAPARGAILDKASQILAARLDEIATTLTPTKSKTLAEAKGEVAPSSRYFQILCGRRLAIQRAGIAQFRR
jgi:acyl-CoA reductase-like NAD-dependent aldehyde dehydrogenase